MIIPSATIRVITFDADGTLFDFQAAMRGALANALRTIQRQLVALLP